MAVEIAGFAQSLARCLDFESVDPVELERVLSGASDPLEMSYAVASAAPPLIQSGTPFTHLLFIQSGTVVPWQYPHSELSAPFLVGEHEFLVDAERWVGSYSAVTDAIVVGIPVSLMNLVTERMPQVQEQMHRLVMRRLARFYWTSLATAGTPASRVAAALVSRLALADSDHGQDRKIEVKQKDLVRLTTMSRSAVSDGLSVLTESGAILVGDEKSARFAGEVVVPDVALLKDHAFADVIEREIRPLVSRNDGE